MASSAARFWASVSYVPLLGPFTALVGLLVAYTLLREEFLRFHAWQALMLAFVTWLLFFIGASIVGNGDSFITPPLGVVSGVMFLLGLATSFVLLVRAWRGAADRLPLLGNLSARFVRP